MQTVIPPHRASEFIYIFNELAKRAHQNSTGCLSSTISQDIPDVTELAADVISILKYAGANNLPLGEAILKQMEGNAKFLK